MSQIAVSPESSRNSMSLGAVAVEIAGADDRPDRPANCPIPRTTPTLRAVHEPDRDVAARVAPQNVAHAVAVEVGEAGDRPGEGESGRGPPRTRSSPPFMSQTARFPPVSRQRMSPSPSPLKSPVATIDHVVATSPTLAVDEMVAPFMNQTAMLPAVVAPEQVGFAVAVEVALADDRPGRRYIAECRRCRDRPRRRSSARRPQLRRCRARRYRSCRRR